MLTGEPIRGFWFNRSAEGDKRTQNQPFDKYEFATPHEVRLSPLPCWAHLSVAKQRAQVVILVEQIEEETRIKNLEDCRTPPGPTAVLAQDPYSHPESFEKRPAPPCHTTIYSMRKAFIAGYCAFVDAYTEASSLFRSGNLDAEFPADCFPPPLPFYKPVNSYAPT